MTDPVLNPAAARRRDLVAAREVMRKVHADVERMLRELAVQEQALKTRRGACAKAIAEFNAELKELRT